MDGAVIPKSAREGIGKRERETARDNYICERNHISDIISFIMTGHFDKILKLNLRNNTIPISPVEVIVGVRSPRMSGLCDCISSSNIKVRAS